MLIVGVDQSMSSSGFCVVHRCAAQWWGLARNAFDRQSVIAQVYENAERGGLDVLWFFEDHSEIPLSRGNEFDHETGEAPTRGTATVLGMGGALRNWLEQLELRKVPQSRLLRVTPSMWRRAVFGKHARGDTDWWKAEACKWASAKLERPIGDHNIAEAVCIAFWGALAGTAKREHDRVITNARARERRKRKGSAAPTGPRQGRLAV